MKLILRIGVATKSGFSHILIESIEFRFTESCSKDIFDILLGT